MDQNNHTIDSVSDSVSLKHNNIENDVIDENNKLNDETNQNNETNVQMNESNVDTNTETIDHSNQQTINEHNNQTEHNNELNNEDNDDNNLDIFRSFYGGSNDNDDDDDEDEDICYYNDDNDDNVPQNDQTMAELSQTNEDQSECDSQSNINRNNKRYSSEDRENDIPIKKIKTEPNKEQTQPKTVDNNADKLTTRIEMSEDIEVPDNTQKFMNELLNWDSNCLEYSSAEKQIDMCSNLLDITDVLRFNDYRFYRSVFIPYILCELWEKIKQIYANRRNNKSNGKLNDSKHLLSILVKFKSKRLTNGLEMKCIFMRRAHLMSQFKFGQLVMLRTAVQLKPNSNAHIVTRNCYFAYVVNHTTRESNKLNQTEVNHLRLISESKRDYMLVEEVTFLLKYVDEIYKRNDALIMAEPLVCVHNYQLQARALYKLEMFPQSKQILKPVYYTKPSGIMREAIGDKFNGIQLDAIQTCLDVLACSSESKFVAINGSAKSGLRKTIIEIIKQIIFCPQFEGTKILFTASNNYNFGYITENLRALNIKAFVISDDSNNVRTHAVKKHIEHKLSKESIKLDDVKRRQYEQCLKFYETSGEYELPVDCVILNNSICDQVNNDLMKLSKVIIGRVDDLCNDIGFYKTFANYNNKSDAFTCCIVDDAVNVTENQLCALFWFSVSKFILTANLNNSRNDGNNRFIELCLSRSYFERYFASQPQQSQQLSQFRTFITLD